jgi:hypothetical protein
MVKILNILQCNIYIYIYILKIIDIEYIVFCLLIYIDIVFLRLNKRNLLLKHLDVTGTSFYKTYLVDISSSRYHDLSLCYNLLKVD